MSYLCTKFQLLVIQLTSVKDKPRMRQNINQLWKASKWPFVLPSLQKLELINARAFIVKKSPFFTLQYSQ